MRRIRKAPQPDLVDLHVHSSVSDGGFTPREVVCHAAEVGLKAIALTDHDTVAGVPEAVAAGRECGVEVIPGVEISTEFEDGACHILGYYVNCEDRSLADLLGEAREGRQTRNVKILARLSELGYPLKIEEVAGRAEAGVITRAHFAGAMLEKGYVKTWDEAFDRFLGRDRPAFVTRHRIMPEDAIRVVRGAQGLTFLAHPRQLNRSPAETDQWIERLAAAGLDGVETMSPDHTSNLGRRYRAAVQRLGLLECGGTDWHGRPVAETDSPDHRNNIHLGLGRGSMSVHYSLVEAMKQRLAARQGKG